MRSAGSVAELCDAAAGCIAQELKAEYTLIRIQSADDAVDAVFGNRGLAPLGQALSMRVAESPTPVVKLMNDSDGSTCAAIGVALDLNGMDSGVIVCVVHCDSMHEARVLLERTTEFSRLLSMAFEGLQDRLSRQSGASVGLATLSKSVTYGSVDEFCFAIANGLRVEVDADVVAVGLVYGSKIQLSCVSGLDEVDIDSPGSQLIRQSMEEAIDAKRTICVQRPADVAAEKHGDGHPLTARWQQLTCDAAVASVPLLNSSGNCVAVVSVQGRQGQSLTAVSLRTISDLTTPLTASVELMKSGRRNLLRHGIDTATRFAQAICGPLRVHTAAFLAVAIATTVWMVFGVTDYIVRTPCTIVAAHTRQLSVPWEATLAQVLVRPGEIVSEGQLLATMDTRQLLSERTRAEAEYRAAEIAVIAAAREPVPALIGRAISRQKMAEAELNRIQHQIEGAEIRSPFRGQIISDDLSERTGETMPMGELLFEIVPDGELAVEVDLPESVLAFVDSGQMGTFSMNARPGVAQHCRLNRIEPAAESGTTGSVVVGRATIEDQAGWLRPGMQGVVQINTGERPVWWAWLHKCIDTMNYEIWSLTGSTSTEARIDVDS